MLYLGDELDTDVIDWYPGTYVDTSKDAALYLFESPDSADLISRGSDVTWYSCEIKGRM